MTIDYAAAHGIIDGMAITYPLVARRHSLRSETIFAKDNLPALSRLEEMSYISIEHLPSGESREFAAMDEGDQQSWMQKMLLAHPADQYPGQSGE